MEIGVWRALFGYSIAYVKVSGTCFARQQNIREWHRTKTAQPFPQPQWITDNTVTGKQRMFSRLFCSVHEDCLTLGEYRPRWASVATRKEQHLLWVCRHNKTSTIQPTSRQVRCLRAIAATLESVYRAVDTRHSMRRTMSYFGTYVTYSWSTSHVIKVFLHRR